MIVVDASALIEYVLGSAKGLLVERLLEAEEDRVHAPALIDVEAAQALRRLVRLGSLTSGRAKASVEIVQEMPLSRHVERPLLLRIWELRDNLTAFDAAYVALAEALQCPLLTFDERIASAPGHTASVQVPKP